MKKGFNNGCDDCGKILRSYIKIPVKCGQTKYVCRNCYISKYTQIKHRNKTYEQVVLNE